MKSLKITPSFNNFLIFLISAFVIVSTSGCAHPVTLAPDFTKIQFAKGKQIDKNIGYYISSADIEKEVISPGGGGDKISYKPYRELDPALYRAFSESFKGVTKLSRPDDAEVIRQKAISLIITPSISTTSFSPSLLTWPPTQFSVELNCTVVDPSGKALTKVTVTGFGNAEFDEFKSNFSLAAQRAANDAIGKLINALVDNPVLRQ